MKQMPAGEFKARCLRVMEDVRKYRSAVVITKKGRPVAKLVPADDPGPDVFGCMAGTAEIVGDVEAPVLPPPRLEDRPVILLVAPVVSPRARETRR